MNDVATLVRRLRQSAIPIELCQAAADTLEAQTAEIAELRDALGAAHKVADMRVMGMISAKAMRELRDRLAKLEREA